MNFNNNALKISIFASGGGGNFQYLVNNQRDDLYKINILVVDRDCGAKLVATNYNIPIAHIKNNNFSELFSLKEILEADIIILAGFMPIVPASFILDCEKRNKYIINTHPSLLPNHGGKGMYGVRVQESVLRSNDKLAGCTAHFVNEGIDEGKIICQDSMVIPDNISAWDLGGEVFKLEGPNLLKAINILSQS